MSENDSWRRLYPFESRYLDLDSVRYHYLDEGPSNARAGRPEALRTSESGTGLNRKADQAADRNAGADDACAPLLMVHGNPTWSFYWRRLVEHWRPRHRVVVPDHVGCGLSDKPDQYDYCLDRHVENLCRLIERLDLRRITLLAHDWGGAIGMGAATRMPDRFARFVLMNTAAFRGRPIPWRIRVCRGPLLGQLLVRGLNGFSRAALWMATCHRERFTPDVRAGYLAPYDNWAHRVAVHRFVRDIPSETDHPSRPTLERIESQLALFRDHPVLLPWGMRDWCFTPWYLERFLEFFPAARACRFDDAGHYIVEDAHERIIPEVVRFFSDHPLLPAAHAVEDGATTDGRMQ
ncbi:MAG: alpha/beta fold hydrolase [Pirellulales bacterium]